MIFFVTGGSRGIGRGIVEVALSAGHDVAFTYRGQKEAAEEVLAFAAEKTPEKKCQAFQLDVRDAGAVESVGDRVLDEFGSVDAVICNAGIVRDAMAMSMSNEEWREVLDTNLSGSFYVARHFLPTFLANQYGRFIFLGSLAMHGISGQANYSASKAGLVGLAKAFGKEYGRKGITANVVVPGFFETDMTRDWMSQSYKDFWNNYCPTGRLGQIQEVAKVVLFLASEASSFVNCETVSVTGGLDWAA